MCKDTTFFRDLQIFPNKPGQNIPKLTKLCDSYFNDIFNVRGDRVGCWCSVGGVFANTPPCSTPSKQRASERFGWGVGCLVNPQSLLAVLCCKDKTFGNYIPVENSFKNLLGRQYFVSALKSYQDTSLSQWVQASECGALLQL